MAVNEKRAWLGSNQVYKYTLMLPKAEVPTPAFTPHFGFERVTG
jgi:hypothetical protein